MLTQIWSVKDIIFGHFRWCFAHLPHYWPGKLKFGKIKKTSADIILLHMCTINQGHLMYGFWDIKCKGQSFLLFWVIFCCSLTLLTTQKIKILKKNAWIYHFTLAYHKWQWWCMVLDISDRISHNRHNFVFFCPFTHLTIQKIKILKKWKKLLDISFTQVYHKWQSYDIWFLRYQEQQTDFFCHLRPFFALLPH